MKHICFTAPWEARLLDQEIPVPHADTPESLIIRNSVSIVSPGTELAILSGGESWAPLPYVPGYGSVGRAERDDRNLGVRAGERVFTHGTHSQLTGAFKLVVPVPDTVSDERAVYARLGAVAMTAIRVSQIELGDVVAVFGAGVVGILAAQLAELAGADVVLFDTCEPRLQVAGRCGIRITRVPESDLTGQLREATGGRDVQAVIDVTGSPRAIRSEMECVGPQGELILLGSPRGSHETDIVPFLNGVHLYPRVATVKGAHEWRIPVEPSPLGHWKHSIRRNVEILFNLLADERLIVDPLTSHAVSPDRAPEVYDGLRNDKGAFLGVLFRWE